MKKYAEILKEITKTKASITDTAKNEKELERLAAREAYASGTDEEKEKARAKYKEAEARYIKELEKNETAKLKIEVLKDNAKQAFFYENINIICDIWNKYEGKPHGEKTADKIRAELKSAVGHYISIRNKWDDACIYISFAYDSGAPFCDIEFHPAWNGNKYPALTDNKIIKLSPERFRVYCCGEYVENVNAHIKALKKAHKTAKDAEKALEEAVSAYNTLTRGSIQHASAREGVKSWLI